MDDKLLARVMAKIRKPEGNDPDACWIWVAATAEGYGRIKVAGRLRQVTHLMFEHFNGPLNGLWVLHRCDTPGCVNPKHLFAGTRSDNMKDCAAKGRLPVQSMEFRERHSALRCDRIDAVRSMIARGLTQEIIARRLGVSRKSLANFMSRHQITRQSLRGRRREVSR